MIDEIETAVRFLSDFLRSKSHAYNGRQSINVDKVDEFGRLLRQTLHDRFRGHWHPGHPLRGSGYRCIINQSMNGKVDPLLLKVGRRAGIPEFLLRRFLPVEMALWIDPADVAYRIGEQGSVCCLFGAEKENMLASKTEPASSVAATSASLASSAAAAAAAAKANSKSGGVASRALTPEKPTARLRGATSSGAGETAFLASDDSGIELSPSSSPRPNSSGGSSGSSSSSSSNNAISNSSSPSSSPLASPIREQPPSSLSTCKEQFQSRTGLCLRDVGVSPSKVKAAGVHSATSHAPLTSFVR